MTDAILVLNAGSSSLKFSLFGASNPATSLLARGQIEGLGSKPHLILHGDEIEPAEEQSFERGLDHEQALAVILERCQSRFSDHRLAAVGHRVVHGGESFSEPVRIDDTVLEKLTRLEPLAPLHQGHNLAAVRAVTHRAPHLPQVACFDTAFHRTQPEVAQQYAVPRRITGEGVRHYGFHGLSYAYIASVLPNFDTRAASGRTVVAHLGNGASLCAMHSGRSVATTMGFTPLDGLVMGTRSGSLDPGVLIHLMSQRGMTASELEHMLYFESGLLGVSGVSSDMRALQASADSRAIEAIDLFVYRIRLELGSMAAALGGLDAIVFTGGIGENAVAIRERICRDAAWLAVNVDQDANAAGGPCISTSNSYVTVWVLPTNEELLIANHTRHVLALNGAT